MSARKTAGRAAARSRAQAAATQSEELILPMPDGTAMHAHLARPPARLARPPARGERRPGVLILHELFGLNDDMRRIAARFAASGYVALAPDLIRGRGPRPLCIVRLFRDLSSGSGASFEAIDAAREHLAALPDVDPSRIGVAGFCLGGGFALLYAAHYGVQAVAPFYGAVPQRRDALRGVCPVVAGYGGLDLVFRAQGERLERHLRELGVEHDVRIYPDAGHSFMSQHPPGLAAVLGALGPMQVGYDEGAAEDSWRRVLDFFERHLRGPRPARRARKA